MTTETLPARRDAILPDRKTVRKFFSFKVNNDDLQEPPVNFTPVLWAGGIAFVVGALMGQFTGAIILGFLGLGAGFGFDRWRAKQGIDERRRKKDENHREFADLAADTRRIQGSDVVKALLRVFERTQIDRGQLRVLDHRYMFRDEQKLFDEETLEQRIGDLLNKSVRLISKGNYNNQAVRKVRWSDTHSEELFFNPTRLVALFLTETQLVICDVQIDSMDGDLREEIQRISLPKIVNIHFTADRTRFSMDTDGIVRLAEDLGYEKSDVDEIRKSLSAGKTDDAPEWVQEEITSELRITRTDGGSLSVPIRSDIYFGRHRSALDQDTALTEDEVRVDRMINELNRLVENTK